MACNEIAFRISKDRIGKPERFDRGRDLIDLPLWMRARIAGIRNQARGRLVDDSERAIGRRGCLQFRFAHLENISRPSVLRKQRARLSPVDSMG